MKQLAVAILLLTLIDGANLPAEERLDSSSPRPVQKTRAGGLGPAESLASLRVADDLAIDQVLTEPTVRQPVFLNFDERGRMWVVQYAQYPHPAGLKIVSRDNFWRNVYDTVPPPPPHTADSPFRGADKITIHEDTNGDGTFDRHKTFLEGLNMCTSVARGRGGAWVLNPPYLLFYPDRDNDDVPDDDPVVHLKGFGLEDSHSIANSLMWGPDGWLYGARQYGHRQCRTSRYRWRQTNLFAGAVDLALPSGNPRLRDLCRRWRQRVRLRDRFQGPRLFGSQRR